MSYNLTKKEFTSPNGVTKTFYFREDTNDENTIIALYVQDYYEILKQNWKKGDVFLDLGTHVGAASVLASTIPDMDLKIIAVEALPENCFIAKKNFIENNVNVKLYANAIWSSDDRFLEIYYGDDSENGRCHKFVGMINYSNSREFAKSRQKISAVTVSLKTIFEKEKIDRVKFLKTDIEGAEREILLESPKEILSRIDYVRGEYHMGNYKKLLEYVSGFEDITPKSMNPDQNSLTEFLWRNVNVG